MIKKDFSGKEVRYLLKQNSVNLSRHADEAIRKIFDNLKENSPNHHD